MTPDKSLAEIDGQIKFFVSDLLVKEANNKNYKAGVKKLESLINSLIAAQLKEARFNSYWGDGSPETIDKMIKVFDPTYDVWKEIDAQDSLASLEGKDG